VPANIQQYQFTSIKVIRYRLTIETATAVEDYKVYANMHNKNKILQKNENCKSTLHFQSYLMSNK